MNYKPNFNAKSLVTQSLYDRPVLTSLTDGTSSSFFADILRGVNKVIDETIIWLSGESTIIMICHPFTATAMTA
ncbi:hypothetical protein PO124_07995 [Bacillus licheniformis]|nr:hypothetical protein [Bacillus licheniformis]